MSKDRMNVDYSAPWTDNLRHRPDPNRVTSLQTPSPRRFEQRPSVVPSIPSDPATLQTGRTRPQTTDARVYDPQSQPGEPSYYDIPILKQPVWKWQIASYFYLGGISAGAYILSRVAERFGGGRYRGVSRIGSYVAMATLLPCPPLLIWDLGDPKRFHHMLRVWKPSTPMNLGTWSIVAYSGMATFEVVRQYLNERALKLSPFERGRLRDVMNNGTLLLLHDSAGIPFALMVAGYTGVLLSCTANPLWCKNPWLGPLFSASAISTGAEAISLAMDGVSRGTSDDPSSQRILKNIDTMAHLSELVCMAGFSRFAGEKSAPLSQGAMKKYHYASLGGIVASEILKRLPVSRSKQKPLRMLSTALGLAAGFSMRWSMIFAGHAAAANPRLSRLVSQPDSRAVKPQRTAIGAARRENPAPHPGRARPAPVRGGT